MSSLDPQRDVRDVDSATAGAGPDREYAADTYAITRTPGEAALLPLGVALFVVGLAAWLIYLLAHDSVRAWQALLLGFVYYAPLGAGLVVWSAVMVASRGRWAAQIENLTFSGFALAIPSLLAVIALWIGSASGDGWLGQLWPGHSIGYSWIFARDATALVIFWLAAVWFARYRRNRPSQVAAGILSVIYAAVFTLIAYDLLSMLGVRWTSSLFGGYFFVSGMYIAMATWTVLAAFQRRVTGLQRRDLASLLLAFCMLTTYTMYAQLMPIWYENLPFETTFLIPRMNLPVWRPVSAALLLPVYLGPLLFLLPRWVKHTRLLGVAAALILSGLWIERWWLIMPNISTDKWRFGIAELGIFIMFAGALLCGVARVRPRLAPIQEVRWV